MIKKIDLLNAMRTIVMASGDEDIFEEWLAIIPDECEELDEIAEDDELFALAVRKFTELAKRFQNASFVFVEGDLYKERSCL